MNICKLVKEQNDIMGKKNKAFCNASLLALALVFAIAACSSSGNSEGGVPAADTNHVQPDIEYIVNPDKSLFDGETLTIANFFEEPWLTLASRYMRENPGVTIEITSYFDERERDGNFNKVREKIATQLMTGGGPVLINDFLVDYLHPRSTHFFTDWLPVMNADPDFNEDDWFMSVFNAMCVNSKLLSFPTAMVYEMVVANKAIPGLAEALEATDSITVPELFELHRSISSDKQYFFEPRNATIAFFSDYYIGEFLDIETGWADFNNERFIEFLKNARGIDNPNEMIVLATNISPAEEALVSEKYAFIFTDNFHWQYAYDFEESLFTGLTPVVNGKGEMSFYPRESFILNANATPVQHALAWDFVKYVTQSYEYAYFSSTNRVQHRRACDNAIAASMEQYFMNQHGWQVDRPIEEAVDEVRAKMAAFTDLPKFNSRGLPDVILEVINEAMRNYNSGMVSAEQTAADLQNKIELVFMEIRQ